MSNVYVVVEGPTEATFVREVLAPWLGYQGVYMTPISIGGNVYAKAKRDMLNFLKQREENVVTCFFDFYGMKRDWPGRIEANALYHDNKALAVEMAIKKDIVSECGDNFRSERLIPYVQMHEFEALLFSYPPAISIALGNKESVEKFKVIQDEFETPEHINDDPNTAPSKRIYEIFKTYNKKYKKVLHGSIAAKNVTIETMLKECPHFKSWVDSIVALGS